MFGGGQDYEQTVVAKDLQNKKDALIQYIEDNGVVVAICGGFQLLWSLLRECQRRTSKRN